MGLGDPCNNDSSAHHPHHYRDAAGCCHSDNKREWIQNYCHIGCWHHCEKGKAVTRVLGLDFRT